MQAHKFNLETVRMYYAIGKINLFDLENAKPLKTLLARYLTESKTFLSNIMKYYVLMLSKDVVQGRTRNSSNYANFEIERTNLS